MARRILPAGPLHHVLKSAGVDDAVGLELELLFDEGAQSHRRVRPYIQPSSSIVPTYDTLTYTDFDPIVLTADGTTTLQETA